MAPKSQVLHASSMPLLLATEEEVAEGETDIHVGEVHIAVVKNPFVTLGRRHHLMPVDLGDGDRRNALLERLVVRAEFRREVFGRQIEQPLAEQLPIRRSRLCCRCSHGKARRHRWGK